MGVEKVRVTRLFGTVEVAGLIDPQVNMLVRHGIDARWIVALDSGNYHASLAMTSGGPVVAKAYPHYLLIDAPQASGWGWPNSAGSVLWGLSRTYPSGVPQTVNSGAVYLGPDGKPKTFWF